MSWRGILGVIPTTETPYAQNSQKAQKSAPRDICAYIADTAYRDSEEESSKLLEALADACRNLAITPLEVKEALAPEDVADWNRGCTSDKALAAFAQSLEQRQKMDQGKWPAHYTERAICEQCGPVWLWFPGTVQGCPWCWNRIGGRPIPRPSLVHCSHCIHFQRIEHPHLGHCKQGCPEPVAGLWDSDQRVCNRWMPINLTGNMTSSWKETES